MVEGLKSMVILNIGKRHFIFLIFVVRVQICTALLQEQMSEKVRQQECRVDVMCRGGLHQEHSPVVTKNIFFIK